METKCSECGKPLGVNAVEELCPECLIKVGLGSQMGATEFLKGEGVRGKKTAFIPPKPEEIAAKFPQLEIIELLGRGGMGAVYKARQKELGRIVALKILPPGIGDEAAFAKRFTHEARALASLNHPNIVVLYEFGQTDGLFFFLMEFVDGVNLRQLLEAGRVAAREALAIVPQICDALQYAHDQGIVHRDIKPENILLDRKGRVKVADFGLARLMGLEAELSTTDSGQGASASVSFTEAGKVMGTPQYMAPEQLDKPAEVDHRADIYALGVVFYQMLTGELPGKKIEAPSKKVHIDVRLDEIVLRALEKKPELRYQQASILKTQVETIAESGSAGVPPAEPGVAPGSSSKKFVNEPSGATPDGTRETRVLPKTLPRFSRTAIVGACWTGLALCIGLFVWWWAMMLTSKMNNSPGNIIHLPFLFQLAKILAVLLGATALFGTTILGWIAVSQIRRSAGKLYGLWLAVFDGLLFPLLALDALIVWIARGFKLGFPEAVLICLVTDVFLIWKIWRVLNPVASSDKTSAPVRRRFGWLTVAGSIAFVALIFACVFVAVMARNENQTRANLKKELTEQIGELLAEKRLTYSRMDFEFSPVLPRAFVTFTKLEDWRNRTNGEPISGALHLTFDDPDACIVRGRGDLAHVRHQFATPLGRKISWPRRVGATENEQFVSDKQFSIASSDATNQTPRTEFAAKLPDGSFVELVCLLYGPGSNPRRTQGATTNLIDFWKPDGTRNTEYGRWSFGPSRLSSTRDPLLEYRGLVARWGGPDANVRLMGWQLDENPQDSADGQFPVTPKGESPENWIGLTQGFPRDKKTATIRFALASGPYVTGAKPNFNWSSSDKTPYGSFTIGKIFDHNGNAAVTLTHNLKGCDYRLHTAAPQPRKPKSVLGGLIWEWKQEFRRGKQFQPVYGRIVKGGAFNQTLEFPGVPAKEAMTRLPSIYFEVRPLQWVEFRNVSLEPGHHTTVQVSDPGIEREIARIKAFREVFGHLMGEETAASESQKTQTNLFGPVIERVLYSVSTQRPVKGQDIDGAKEIEVPENILKGGEEVVFQWIAEHGIDLMAFLHKKHSDLWTSLKLASADADLWEKSDAAKIDSALQSGVLKLKLGDSSVWSGFRTYDITGLELPQTFAFQTVAGNRGVLQITGFTENPRGVKIRYKLVQALQRTPRVSSEIKAVMPNLGVVKRGTPVSPENPMPILSGQIGSASNPVYVWCGKGATNQSEGVLPNGGRVRLHAIGDAKRWWSPTGELLPEDPEWKQFRESWPDREFICVVEAIYPDAKSEPTILKFAIPHMTAFGISPQPDQQPQLTIGLGAGAWQSVGSDAQSPAKPGFFSAGEVSCQVKSVGTTRRRNPNVPSSKGQTEIHFWLMGPREVEAVLIAIAKDGRQHAIGYSRGITDSASSPNERWNLGGWVDMEAEEIERLELRTRPRGWAAFMGFATQPDTSPKK